MEYLGFNGLEAGIGAASSWTLTRLPSQTLAMPADTAIQPSQWKFSNCPDGALVTTQPPMLDATPIARSRAQPLRLMNAPRREAGTASVMMRELHRREQQQE